MTPKFSNGNPACNAISVESRREIRPLPSRKVVNQHQLAMCDCQRLQHLFRIIESAGRVACQYVPLKLLHQARHLGRQGKRETAFADIHLPIPARAFVYFTQPLPVSQTNIGSGEVLVGSNVADRPIRRL